MGRRRRRRQILRRAQLAGPRRHLHQAEAAIGEFQLCLVCRHRLTVGVRLSNHWQWVIFLVVMVVGIAGIWIGACIWRRRYLRKRDRQTTLGQKHSGSAKRPSWGPGVSASGSGSVAPAGTYDTSAYEPNRTAPGVFVPGVDAASAPYEEEKPKKKK